MAKISDDQYKTMLANRWFGSIPVLIRDEILECAQLREFPDGASLYFKGQAAKEWFGLVEGAVKVSSTSERGKEGLLTFVEPGTWFAEISLFDGMPRTHDGVAHVDSTVLAVAAKDFHAMLERHPSMLSHFIQLHCHRMRLMFAALEEWNTLPFEERLMRQLSNLAKNHGKSSSDFVEIMLHLPQEDLAQLLGVSRQRVNQTLKVWERDGWVRFHYGSIFVSHTFLKKSEETGP